MNEIEGHVFGWGLSDYQTDTKERSYSIELRMMVAKVFDYKKCTRLKYFTGIRSYEFCAQPILENQHSAEVSTLVVWKKIVVTNVYLNWKK